jgi:hypothetical protein
MSQHPEHNRIGQLDVVSKFFGVLGQVQIAKFRTANIGDFTPGYNEFFL